MPNALQACNLEGRLEKIESMLASLEKCEKALADYLETKRAAYPRFYFVASADLLDILSKGSNPQLILKHLPKYTSPPPPNAHGCHLQPHTSWCRPPLPLLRLAGAL